MLIKNWKIYVIFFVALFFADWFMGVARFYWPLFGAFFAVINFPFSFPLNWLEGKTNLWWYGVFGHRFNFIFNDEIGMAIAFLLMVILQSILLATLYLSLKKLWRNRLIRSNA